MNRRIKYGEVPAGNPLVNALMVIVGVVAVVATIVLGVVAFLVVAGIILVLAGIVGIRLWWYRRKVQKSSGAPGESAFGDARDTRVIEGEYHSVSTRNEREHRDQESASSQSGRD